MIVYKYRPVDKYTLELLINNELHFSFPKDFNDPFDSYIDSNISGTRKEIQSFINNDQELPKLWKEDILNKLKKTNYDKEVLRTFFLKDKEYLRKNIYICCFSKTINNILLWSHYSNCHKGVALGFNFTSNRDLNPKPIKNDLSYVRGHSEYSFLKKVSYSKRKFVSNIFVKSNDQEFKKNFITKSSFWEYEKEYRIVFLKDEFPLLSSMNQNVTFDKKILKEIIFGLWIPDKDKKTIKKIVFDNYTSWGYNVKFFQCERKKDEYGLNIVPA